MQASLKATLLSVVVLLAAAAVSYGIVATAPKPGKKNATDPARLVDAQPLKLQSSRPVWRSGGVVQAAEKVSLTPQVSGRVVALLKDAVPGAWLEQGSLLAQIEDDDYQLLLAQRMAAVTQAKADLDIERGEAALAREEYSLSGQALSSAERALVLREPQQAKAEAALANAQALLQQAQLDVKRTQVRMPFDGQLLSRSVSSASYVTPSSSMFELVRTDTFWLEVRLPRHFLPWLDVDQPVVVRQPNWRKGQQRHARVVNVLAGVDSSDRQARVLLAIDQPLNSTPNVLVNEYLDVTLVGKTINEAYAVAVDLLNDDDSLWVIRDGHLRQLQPDIIYRDREQVWLNAAIEDGDQLLLSRIDALTEGMAVRVASEVPDSD